MLRQYLKSGIRAKPLITSLGAFRCRSSRTTHANDFDAKSSVPLIPSCPTTSCKCADMPQDLEIERSKDLFGTMAAYNDHLLISTGQADWKSRIEDEELTAPWGKVTACAKRMLGPKGALRTPDRNVVVSTSSFSVNTGSSGQVQALLFPSFVTIDGIHASADGTAALLKKYVSKECLARDTIGHPSNTGSGSEIPEATNLAGYARPITTPTILICSHNSRDSRCGVLGPLLHAKFVQYIGERSNKERTTEIPKKLQHNFERHLPTQSVATSGSSELGAVPGRTLDMNSINVGMISHIGGHKWAGNVIIYIPPNHRISQHIEGESNDLHCNQRDKSQINSMDSRLSILSPLAGKGIWYGRVEPRHIEGIVDQTIDRGQVIRDLFRGGIHKDGSSIWI